MSEACSLLGLNTRKLTRSRRGKDSQIHSSFLVFSMVVHGRFFVDVVIFWLIPFAHET